MSSERIIDRTAGWLGIAFLLVLLASEAALSLPDEHASARSVAAFYAEHRTFIIVLQIVGFVAALLLGLFAWRLRRIGPGVAGAGIMLAVLALAPGVFTLLTALVADPAQPAAAGRLNHWEPRGDDLLFLGVTVFAVMLATGAWSFGRRGGPDKPQLTLGFLGRQPRWLGLLAAVVAVCCLTRFVVELLGRDRGVLDVLAPVSFLVLIAALTWLCFRGLPSMVTPLDHRARPVGRRRTVPEGPEQRR